MAVPGQTQKPGWVSVGFPARPPVAMLPPAHFGKVAIEAAPAKAQQVPARLAGHRFTAWLPGNVQTISGENLETLIAGPGGGALMAPAGDRDPSILSDLYLIYNPPFLSRAPALGVALLIAATDHSSAPD